MTTEVPTISFAIEANSKGGGHRENWVYKAKSTLLHSISTTLAEFQGSIGSSYKNATGGKPQGI